MRRDYSTSLCRKLLDSESNIALNMKSNREYCAGDLTKDSMKVLVRKKRRIKEKEPSAQSGCECKV